MSGPNETGAGLTKRPMALCTVSEAVRWVKESLERDPRLADLWVTGEVSNFRKAASGHNYFTLKDGQGQLQSVVFRTGRGGNLLAEGLQVSIHGRISFYELRGVVQLVGDLVMPAGAGALALALEELRLKLEQQGLFDQSRKRPLPAYPKVVGLVTSPAGAVLHDICNVMGRRWPLAEALLAPTAVQGESAAPGIVAALESLNREGRSDLIILARGGGSLEELWPFNEETVARAIYASRIPVISAIGHETDFTIADDVADLRAPTPSAAAELAVPDVRNIVSNLEDRAYDMTRAVLGAVGYRRRNVASLVHRVHAREPDTRTLRESLARLESRVNGSIRSVTSLSRMGVDGLEKRLRSLDPRSVLNRGYAIVQRDSDGRVVSKTADASAGDGLHVTVSDGRFPATVGKQAFKPRAKKRHARAGAPLL